MNVDKILNIFKKTMTLIADVFAKLWTPKNVGRLMSKKSHVRRLSDKQHGKSDQTLLKSEPLAYLLINVKAIDFEGMPVNDMQSVKTVC